MYHLSLSLSLCIYIYIYMYIHIFYISSKLALDRVKDGAAGGSGQWVAGRPRKHWGSPESAPREQVWRFRGPRVPASCRRKTLRGGKDMLICSDSSYRFVKRGDEAYLDDASITIED